MRDIINIKRLTTLEEAELLDQEFAKRYGWYRQGDYYHKCLSENNTNKRVTMIAYYNDSLAGCCHLIYESQYPYFIENNIPEINDLNVFPEYRRKHIANRLFDEVELIASKTSTYIGLGVGLYRDYGNAQRMYTSRGYVMDGRGMSYKNVQVIPGESVKVDDDLLIYLVKNLKSKL
ncbi:N-acetyltransferase [Paenibacillus lautus]|uniref:GNAT family N-acetyltransferase n=1 Tax=Paenibacillus lautus TaxID=1401 RepID=UPI001B1E75A6|nr:GNAT family N-acetyltransferase [Paenibacillus lautus]GIO95988.1 N-acetyltransferase [Paenibacillus lautus]